MTTSLTKSQKAADRPISFILEVNGTVKHKVDLYIRPEDMSVTFPSRMSVNQTLGGAWVDSFGPGLETMTISGTMGWRKGTDGFDGIERVGLLKNQFFTAWHDERAKAIKLGTDPNAVKLRYVDTLNRYSRIMAPQVFELRRSKSRPLLAQYRFSMIAVMNPPPVVAVGGAAASASSGADPSGFGVSSLLGSINRISDAARNARQFVNSSILGPVRNFMTLSNDVLGTVHSYIAAGSGVPLSLIGVARDIAQVGTNIFRTLAAANNLPMQARVALMQVAGAYSNSFCVMKNALASLPTYEDYRTLHGASNCSSTSGGSPPSQYADRNPFISIVPLDTRAVSVTPRASAAISAIVRNDIIAAPLSMPAISGALTDIAAGVVMK